MANTIDFYINNWIPKVYDRVPKAPNYQHSIMCDSLLGDASIGDDSRTKGYSLRLRFGQGIHNKPYVEHLFAMFNHIVHPNTTT